MWHTLRLSRSDPAFETVVAELLQATARTLILVTGAACLVWYATTLVQPDLKGIVPYSFALVLAIVVVAALAHWILPKAFLAAQWLWQLGLAATITLALWLVREPEIAYFYALVPFMATATSGWFPGLLAEGFVIALVFWLSRSAMMPSLAGRYIFGTAFGGAFGAVLAWAATKELLKLAEWSMSNYERIRDRLDEAADQRAELKQVQQDLVHRCNGSSSDERRGVWRRLRGAVSRLRRVRVHPGTRGQPSTPDRVEHSGNPR